MIVCFRLQRCKNKRQEARSEIIRALMPERRVKLSHFFINHFYACSIIIGKGVTNEAIG